MHKKHIVRLTPDQRQLLTDLLGAGQAPARKLAHARILLKADQGPDGPGWTDAAIATAVEVSRPTVERVRKLFGTQGLELALNRRPPRRAYHRKLDGRQEAQLIVLACSAPVAGHARWTLKLLADRLVALEVVHHIAPETVRQVLRTNELKPWLRQQRVFPPQSQR